MDRANYSALRKSIVVSGLPGNARDSGFCRAVWTAVLGAVARGGRCDVPFLMSAFQNQPRDCLMTPKRRRELVATMGPLLEGDGTKITSFVVSVVQLHSAGVASNSGVCRWGYPHALLYVAAEVALHSEFDDSTIVSGLLRSIAQCDGGLDKLIAPVLLGSRLTHVLSNWKPHCEDSHHLSALTYFLNHSAASKLKIGSFRVPDAPLPTMQSYPPLTVAIQVDNVPAVRLLLSHGADPLGIPQTSPLIHILQKLSTYARSVLAQRTPCTCDLAVLPPGSSKNTKFHGSTSEPYSLPADRGCCPCDQVHPIAWPKPSVQILELLLSCSKERRLPRHPEITHNRIISDDLLPFPSLMQLSRHKIRSLLNGNWALPDGVLKLPLPLQIINYLALKD